MKSKGFTLIELLAVIVILAIIALIATPVILGIINNVKDESNKRSIEMYADAIKNAVAQHQLTSPDKIIGSFDSQNEGKQLIQEGKTPVEIDYNGNVVCDAIEIYVDGSIYLANCKVNGEPVDYTYGNSTNSSVINKTYANGDIVYFDVDKGIGCTKEEYESSWDETTQDYLNSKTGYNGINGTGNQTSCLKFYAFLDDASDKINLLLDHNTSNNVYWSAPSTDAINGPIELLTTLYNDTKEWNGTRTPKDYEVKYGDGNPNYIIDYDNLEKPYKARIIEANEIAQIVGYEGVDGTDGTIYLSDKVGTEWLYNGNQKYWTSTAACKFEAVSVWYVDNSGKLTSSNAPYSISYYNQVGLRPVIEVAKSNL